MKKVIVIGGGAAGMIAAGYAAECGHAVRLFEKNDRLGKKLLITGKGRCNVTNHCDVEDLLENIPRNPYFLYSALYTFDSAQTIAFFEALGVQTKVERGNRVFPVSDRAADIVDALARYIKKNHVTVRLNQAVSGLWMEAGRLQGVRLPGGRKEAADAVIIATGGLSYPGTGSTGDGYKMAKEAGLSVTKCYPSLVPLRIEEGFCRELMGLSLRNIALSVKDESGKTLFEDFGEMLFTHYGVSGPVILSASGHMAEQNKRYSLVLDLKPALDEKTLDKRILRDFEKYANKDYKNALSELLPQKLIPVIVKLSQIPEEKKVHEITKEERKRLLLLMKGLRLHVAGPTGFSEAVITRGGVAVEEINPSTMESKKVPGLYFAGEVLDVDGYTGGFNLQIAFSTGYLAAQGLEVQNGEGTGN